MTLTAVDPAYRHAPEYAYTLGDEVADLCSLAGFAPDPEQRLGLDLLFACDKRDRVVAFEFAVICARQNLKTGLFKQAALGWMFLLDLELVVWSAHEFSTAQEAFRDMTILIEGCDFLERRVKHIRRANGDEAIELKNGCRLKFKARTKSGGRGLTGDRVVLDEAFALQPDHMGALLPTLSVRPDPQVVYGSSAGLATSDVLRGVRDRGRAGTSPRLAYLEWCAAQGGCQEESCKHVVGTPGCALDDVDNRRAANPLLGRTRANGTGLTYEYLEAERQALPAEEFARERLGWWDEPGTAEAFGAGNWEACVQPLPDIPVRGLAVAVSYDLSKSAVVAAGVDGDVTHAKPLQHGPGTTWVVARAKALQQVHGVPVVVDKNGPAAMLLDEMKAEGVDVLEVDTHDVCDACADLFNRVQDQRFGHQAYPELNVAAAGAVKRSVGDRWAWGRKQSDADISPLEAATLAAWQARQPAEAAADFYTI